ncbi:Disease resistance protein [Quillaja saponaria]|uniref:Disease resistance protein n=1 Tax=Quillaja saponaria TaxID=32244 RepID=A0AAD7VI79_QUISA|nr:Disease resistance protein [Quillaja saponaria]
MAEGILCSIAEAILRKLSFFAVNEIQLATSFKKDLEKLNDTLSTIRAVLLDAEQQEVNHAVKDWLRKLKDVLHDAQDLLDDLSVEALRQNVEAEWWLMTKVRNFFFCSEMGRRIVDIREKLEAISEERRAFHFREQVGNHLITKREETYSFVRFTEVVGRENDKNAIVELLLGNTEESLSVIPIVGMGGLGKTTLAQLAFNDDSLKGYFDLRIWVCVSDDINEKKIVQKIIEDVAGVDYVNRCMEYLHRLLLEILKGKKFLLVLDDVWNGNYAEWYRLRNLLTDGAKGSKILVTTRYKNSASVMGTVSLYHLAGLSDDDCWSLFEKWAFREGESTRYQNLVIIGFQLVGKCGGVPLAIRTLGSLLRLEREESYWLSVKNNEILDIAQEENDILPVLWLSYDQLPSNLKECFAYCSLLPKGQEFDKDTLIQLWMAQDFIQSSNGNEQLEDIGSWYFDELVSRSFFDVVHQNYKAETVKCRMHDLVHDLAKSVAGKECLTVKFGTTSIFKSVRHVSFFGYHQIEDVKPLRKVSKLRTLLLPVKLGRSLERLLDALLPCSTFLRVLDLSYSDIEYLPSCIGDIKHLRYLNLNGNNSIKYLPDSICKLYLLQTLKLLGCVQIGYFPTKFSNLKSLRHLVINSPRMRIWEKQIESLTSLQYLRIVHCDKIVSLSEGMQHLTSLRTLHIHNCGKLTSLPSSIGNFIALQNLEIVNCPKISLFEDWGLGLVSLRSLVIKGLPQLLTLPQGIECYPSTLQSLLIIDCLNLMTLPECLGNLASLKRLYISRCPYLPHLPDSFHHLTSLQVLQIDQCPLLSTRCTREVGADWHKIAHVQEIYVDKVKI